MAILKADLLLQNAPYPTSIILFFIFTLVIVFSMIILLLIMVSVSVTCNDSEEKLTSNMEQNQAEVAGEQVEFILADLHNAVSSETGTQSNLIFETKLSKSVPLSVIISVIFS